MIVKIDEFLKLGKINESKTIKNEAVNINGNFFNVKYADNILMVHKGILVVNETSLPFNKLMYYANEYPMKDYTEIDENDKTQTIFSYATLKDDNNTKYLVIDLGSTEWMKFKNEIKECIYHAISGEEDFINVDEVPDYVFQSWLKIVN